MPDRPAVIYGKPESDMVDRAGLGADMLALLGPTGWKSEVGEAHSRDWLLRYGEPPLGLALPSCASEVASVVRICRTHNASITPQGGNTSLCGGSVLGSDTEGIILSLSRMNRVIDVDTQGLSVTVEAGLVLANLHKALDEVALMFPMYLGSHGSAQIGGLIGTNAGGSHVARYGMMQDLVLGLEVVTADGEIWDGCRALLKDNGGYQLRRLFCGSEGTLGIVTKAVLRLFPAPTQRATALLGISSLHTAYDVAQVLRKRMGQFLSALEFFSDFGASLVRAHLTGIQVPSEASQPFYLLAEFDTAAPLHLAGMAEAALEACFEADLVLDGIVATSEAQRRNIWHLREVLPEAQRLEGSQIKHDIAVPVARLAAFIDEASTALAGIRPGIRINPFGHFGDGNVHFNLSPPIGDLDFGDAAPQLSKTVYDLVVAHGGTISAEHGLGSSKVALAERYRSKTERAMMLRIKQALDPAGRLNPGKMVATLASGQPLSASQNQKVR